MSATINKTGFFFFLLFISLIIFTVPSCEVTQPISNSGIILSAEDASCTEAWIELKLQNINLPAELQLFRNDSVLKIINVESTDTLLYLEGLQPNQTYSFYSTIPSFQNYALAKSNTISVTTMDTTSHNFTWETFTFGGSGGSSYLKDVAIITPPDGEAGETHIWAVGEIHTEDTDKFDSNGVWVKPYNAVHWDGTSWELKRIMFYIDPDQPSAGKTSSSCESIFVFDEDNFIISSNVQVAFINSENIYTIKKMSFDWKDRFTINSIWGTSSNDFYVVGNGGNIAHYNGSPSANGWTKIESGTDLDIYDIWGDYNEKSGEYEILAVAAKLFYSTDRDILSITKSGVDKLDETGINWSLHGIWFRSGKKYYAVGSGIYIKNKLDSEIWWNDWQSITKYYIKAIYGQDQNDLFMVGSYGELIHYNGLRWHSYLSKELPIISGSYMRVKVKGNMVCTVGYANGQGIIVKGKRN